MSRSGFQVVILIATITILGLIGFVARRKVKNHEDMYVAGRTSTASTLFWAIFSMWGGNSISAAIELGADLGVVGIWFGIARILFMATILFVSLGPFRSVGMVTISEFTGNAFKAPVLKLLTGANIGFNFVFLLVSAIVGAQAFFVTLLGWSTPVAVLFTVFSFSIYTLLAGMYGITYTGRLLGIGQMLGLVVAVVWVLQAGAWPLVMHLPASYFQFVPVKHWALILVWVYSFINNAFTAQAVIQIIMSCKTIQEGKRGLKWIIVAFTPTMILATFVGMAVKALFPAVKGIHAAPTLALAIQSPILSTLVVLGLYLSSVGWGAPLVLSGGTCLAHDVYCYFKKNATSRQNVNASVVGGILVTVLAVVFAIAIPSGVAFWIIVGFVARNCAVFPLLLIAIFWQLLSTRWAIIASFVGPGVGLGWYVLKYPKFLWNAHPMFVGMLVSITILMFGTLWECRANVTIALTRARDKVWMFLTCLSALSMALTLIFTSYLHGKGLFVPLITIEYTVLFIGVLLITKDKGKVCKTKVAELEMARTASTSN